MAACECGCGATLTGKQQRFKTGRCRMDWWSAIRRNAALGRGLGELLNQKSGVRGPGSVLKPAGKMHKRNVVTNARLQRLLAFLQSGPKTTIEIRDHLNSTAASTEVSDLRHNGFDIRTHYLRRTSEGRKVYLYTLVGEVAA